jgi:hypothetical protein
MQNSYRGFELKACVEQLVDSGNWTTRVAIIRYQTNETLEKICSASNTFVDRSDAEQRSIEFGREIVDSRHQNARVDDML